MAQKLFDKASLVMIPSQYKEGKIYNIKPEDQSSSFEFERGSAATRVNSSGLIETFYDEATNLLLQSNQFDTTWDSPNSTPTSGQVGYDGTNDAWLLNADSTGTSRYVRQLLSASGVVTFSFYAKAGTTDYVRLQITGSSTRWCYFDLSDETVGFTSGLIETTVENIGNGWKRCSAVVNDSSITDVRIYIAQDDTATVNEGDNIYIQDAQLESGYFATPYIETTTEAVTRPNRHDTPRLDYSGTEPALLLEPQRTNLLSYSGQFDSSYWSSTTDVIIEGGYLSPDGSNNAYKVTKDGSNAKIAVVVSGTAPYSKSIYARTLNGTGTAYFGEGEFTGDGVLSTVTEQWQRFDITTNQSNFYAVDFRGASTLTEVLIYGAQFEQGSYATSYIPTNGQAETRIFESFDNKSLEDYLKTVDTTFFLEFNNDNPREGSTSICRIYSGADFFGIKGISGTSPYLQVTGFTADFSGVVNIADSINNTKHKVILRVTENLIEVFYNGAKLTDTITRSSTNIWDRLFTSAQGYLQKINGITIFDTSLSDQECINLTTI